jgi:hypothetical protein
MRSLPLLLVVLLSSNALAQNTAPTPAPTPKPSPTPTPAPPTSPPPQFAGWQSNMLRFGSQHCLAAARGTLDERLGATYYDSLRVYLNILLYTRDPKWNQCIAASLTSYRGYVMANGGLVPGYWNFTGGLRLHFQQTGDTVSRSAVALLAKNAAYCADGTPAYYTASASLSREVAYCIEARLDAMALGVPKTAYYDLMVTTALRHLDQWWVSKTYRAQAQGYDGLPGGVGNYYIQPFMVGLTTHALMREWERSHDARILPLVKAALDGLWSRTWVSADQAFWYENFATNPANPFPPQPGAPDLNQLIAPAFLLYSKATGDTSYRNKADAIFAGGVVGAFLENPKHFNQNYMWSFEYVKRR